MSGAIKFSICHATARPEGWMKSYETWMSRAAHPEDVEYLLAVDDSAAFKEGVRYLNLRLVVNHDRPCPVDAYNAACREAKGKVLILGSDDMFCPEHWDLELSKLISDWGSDFVIEVSSGTPADSRGLMVLNILSSARYQRFGYALYPGYDGMFADDDFGEHARQDGVVIDGRHLLFPHEHPIYNSAVASDALYRSHNAPEKYELGAAVLNERRATRFGEQPASARKTSIAICLPGEQFSNAWVSNWTNLFTWLLVKGYDPAPLFTHTSSVFVTRSSLVYEFRHSKAPFDLMLWIDDDNIVFPEHLEKLIQDLEEHPEADVVAGWCWIEPPRGEKAVTPSCGRLKPGYFIDAFKPEEIRAAAGRHQLMPADYTGFPVVLMRYSVLSKLGEHPFMPFTSPEMRWGTTGEDVAFCARLKEAGGKLFIDPNVKVPHLKLMEIADPPEPVALKESAAERAESGDGGPRILARIKQVFQPGHRANSQKEGVHV